MKLIIEGYNKSLHKKDNQLVIYEKGEIIDSIKASEVKDITIIGKGYITFDALNLIAKNNIKLISLDYYTGKLNYVLESPNQNNVILKKKQYMLSENRTGLKIVLEIIKSKINNQKSTLTTLNKHKQLKEVQVHKNNINNYSNELNNLKLCADLNKSKMKIMGIEGKCSYEYWQAIKLLTPLEIGFINRTKKVLIC